ncbi:hypothetical protein K488DRAFT_89741 [Vararia minispora EC-137]|uniref:Uncharacterized protein n=1 Tax=Vararia minispora EC-137 TaxID=1314806 RepID=A0ACB8Q9Y1_9AGAM|nr:hypothetical protein K488DRAFT_89741 [Vararia minispora EC-137]
MLHTPPQHAHLAADRQSAYHHAPHSHQHQPVPVVPSPSPPHHHPQHDPHARSPIHPPASASVSPVSPTAGPPVPSIRSPPASGRTPGPGSGSGIGRGSLRKEISNVVIACRQCRARKIKCDSTRPACHNCLRRNNPCEYDAQPRRRGPDKRPGTRQRSCKKRPAAATDLQVAPPPPPKKRRRTATMEAEVPVKLEPPEALPYALPALPTDSTATTTTHKRPSQTIMDMDIQTPIPSHPTRTPNTTTTTSDTSLSSLTTPDSAPGPSSDPGLPRTHAQDAWWDDLLDSQVAAGAGSTREQAYVAPSGGLVARRHWSPSPSPSQPLTLRLHRLRAIDSDLATLFRANAQWLSFLDAPALIQGPPAPGLRAQAPALAYALLALATLGRSSELERGDKGRQRALVLRDRAQAELERAWDARAVAVGDAQAALVLALFETSAHPLHAPHRANAAIALLDAILSFLGLKTLDRDAPARALDTTQGVPLVVRPAGYRYPEICDCAPCADPLAPELGPVPDPQEGVRKLVWTSLLLATTYSITCVIADRTPDPLDLLDPSRFELCLPAEATDGADSVPALVCRALLLWNAAVRLSAHAPERAVDVVQETRELEELLDAHAIGAARAGGLGHGRLNVALCVAREMVANVRLAVARFTRRITADDTPARPHIDGAQAEEWLYHQEQIAAHIVDTGGIGGANKGAAQVFGRRPFLTHWFVTHAATCLELWTGDVHLLRALELAKRLLDDVDVLNALWPCVEFRHQGASLRERVKDACAVAGLPPPAASSQPFLSQPGIMPIAQL